MSPHARSRREPIIWFRTLLPGSSRSDHPFAGKQRTGHPGQGGAATVGTNDVRPAHSNFRCHSLPPECSNRPDRCDNDPLDPGRRHTGQDGRATDLPPAEPALHCPGRCSMLPGIALRAGALPVLEAVPPLSGTVPAPQALLRERTLPREPGVPQWTLPVSGRHAALWETVPPAQRVL